MFGLCGSAQIEKYEEKFKLVSMMNQINSDLDARKNGSKNLSKRLFNFVREFELFAVLVLMGSTFIILFGVFSDSQALQMTGLVSYLLIALLVLSFYIAATTRTVNASISYRFGQVIKRFVDLVLAFLGLQLLSPLFILFAVLLRWESPGPVFFYSVGVGQYGKFFRKLRFRTRYLAPGGGFTKVGYFLRETRLYQLPQLWNVLLGEMSLVGPVTRSPDELKGSLDPEGKILTVKPGITGILQITELPREVGKEKDAVELELKYVQTWNLALDIEIIFKTLLLTWTKKSPAI
jgi:lipopolysaccharide/colanic/teichoic acid biosynthesis glycosyltransferase